MDIALARTFLDSVRMQTLEALLAKVVRAQQSSGFANQPVQDTSGCRPRRDEPGAPGRGASVDLFPAAYRSAMNDDANHDSSVEQNPADAGEVNCLVVFLNPIDKPQTCGAEIRNP
jgi:hypothetical protein